MTKLLEYKKETPRDEKAIGDGIKMDFLAGAHITGSQAAMYERMCQKDGPQIVEARLNGFKFKIERLKD